MKLLITGASGYIGSSLVNECLNKGFHVKAIVRMQQSFDERIEQVMIGDLSLKPDLAQALDKVDVVIHAAARAHIMNDHTVNPLTEFRRINTDATIDIATQAAKAGVKQFIFISSIGVNGNTSLNPFKESDTPNPKEPYAISKYEAELELLALAKKTDLEVVIVRPPLVYGPNAPGNFGRLLHFVYKYKVLPFGSVRNHRSFIALDNLTNFIIHCFAHPKAANEIFLISDGEDVTTIGLLHKVAKAFGKKIFLIPVPVSLMRLSARILGKSDMANRLFCSLQVDNSKACDLLGWSPIVTMDEELTETAMAYLKEKC